VCFLPTLLVIRFSKRSNQVLQNALFSSGWYSRRRRFFSAWGKRPGARRGAGPKETRHAGSRIRDRGDAHDPSKCEPCSNFKQ
jgi:hypothetical protein